MKATLNFVEYIIAGVLALIWLSQINSISLQIPQNTALAALGAMPFLFALGMFLDWIFSFATKPCKKIIKSQVKERLGIQKKAKGTTLCVDGDESSELYSMTQAISCVSSDLAQDIADHSMRDRVARNLCGNLFFSVPLQFWNHGPQSLNPYLTMLAVFLSFCLWWTMETLSVRFKYRAFFTLEKLGKFDASSGD